MNSEKIDAFSYSTNSVFRIYNRFSEFPVLYLMKKLIFFLHLSSGILRKDQVSIRNFLIGFDWSL